LAALFEAGLLEAGLLEAGCFLEAGFFPPLEDDAPGLEDAAAFTEDDAPFTEDDAPAVEDAAAGVDFVRPVLWGSSRAKCIELAPLLSKGSLSRIARNASIPSTSGQPWKPPTRFSIQFLPFCLPWGFKM
jgi:hypothetical protein